MFQVDLFAARGDMPTTLAEASEREKDIRYSSRTRLNTTFELRRQATLQAARRLVAKLPASLRDDPDAKALAALPVEAAVVGRAPDLPQQALREPVEGLRVLARLDARALGRRHRRHAGDARGSALGAARAAVARRARVRLRVAQPQAANKTITPTTTSKDTRHMSKQLPDKIAIVTGAASGIGKEIAAVYAREGAKVAIADMNLAAAQAAADELRRAAPAPWRWRWTSPTKAQVNAAVAAVVAGVGRRRHPGQQRRHPDRPSARGVPVRRVEEDARDPPRRRLPHHQGLPAAHVRARAAAAAIIYMGSVHSKEASVLKAPYVTAKHGLIGLAKVIAKEGAKHGVRANVICPGFVRTPLVDKQIPEQAKALGISEDDVIKKVMLKDTVDGEFTTVADVAEVALFSPRFPTNALTGQSLVVSHGWFMQ